MAEKYIGQMHYNHLGQPFHTIKKTSSVRSLMQKAQEMIRDALPIKCLEAVVIAMFLTMKMDIDRITVSFKSNVNGNVYRHIVLAIRLGDRWGAIGLSRKADLMNKDLIYPNLVDGHTLERIKMGLPLTHNPTSNELVPWKELVIPMDDQAWREIEQHARRCKTLA
ncbi:Vasohibin-domain-containing protein [Gorgonomyces haynaldii]|nr:Vasohibin-domain-containing protein [Gorgonomyces haynaldii]